MQEPPSLDLTDPSATRSEYGGDAVRPLAAGIEVIRAFVKKTPAAPGVYRMHDSRGNVLYVGKARNLAARVNSYTQPARLANRLRRMVAETAGLEIVVTHTEVEALLLEINLIKQLKPRYNVLLRDDKSFPYIHLTGDSEWPQVTKHRGAQVSPGEYFGPFASAGSVNRTLTTLQRAFLLRSCSDTVFTTRTRPCLLHQIKRCSAPCVGRIDPAAYADLVAEARAFLRGDSAVQHDLARRMEEASAAMQYETAALYRDRIRALSQVQAHQDINVAGLGDADVFALQQEGGIACVQVFFFRGGQNYGNRPYFPANGRYVEGAELMAAFLGQFYSDRPAPGLVLTSSEVAERELLAEALSLRAGRRVRLETPQRGAKRNLVAQALANAREALGRRLAESATQIRLLEGVAAAFALDAPPHRIEVYDNSHIGGTLAVGAMIVAGPEGLIKSQYRKFNIRGAGSDATRLQPGEISPGDDYGMLRQVLGRRFGRVLKEDPGRESDTWPDLVLIDGGAGQLSAATEVLAELGLSGIPIVAIAKGPDRDAGRERFFMPGREPFTLPFNDPTLYFLQRLRDEAHRFAIGSHRARRSKAVGRSALDEIAGIGSGRKRALLHHFGSARSVARAGLADLEAVTGVSKAIARRIYEHFHPHA